MTDKKISELGTITQGDIASGDWVAVVDSSENATKKFDFSVVIAATNSFDDVTAFFASTDTYTTGTIVRTRAEGFAYKAVDTATATTVANAGGQAFEVLSDGAPYNVLAYNVSGDAITDDAAAFNKIVGNVFIPAKTYRIGSTIEYVQSGMSFKGAGRWTDSDTPATVLSGDTDNLATVLRLKGPPNAVDGQVQGSEVSDLVIRHNGIGAAMEVDNVIRAYIHDMYIRSNGAGEVGLRLKKNAFFARIERVNVQGATDHGILVEGTGSAHALRDCHVQGNSVSAVEVKVPSILIEGGQINSRLNSTDPDTAGVGVRFYNDSGSVLYGGSVKNVLCEGGWSVDITGPNPWHRVVVEGIHLKLFADRFGVRFDNAFKCLLKYPQVQTAGGTGRIAEWTSRANQCGVILDGQLAATNEFKVDPNASLSWMQVYDTVPLSVFDNVFTDPNLTVICDYVVGLGRCIHNGVAWNKGIQTINDDAVAVITPPQGRGVFEISTQTSSVHENFARVYYQPNNRVTAAFSGPNVDVIDSSSGLSGTTGVDGKLSIALDNNGDINVENRTGAARGIIYRFDLVE